MRTKRITMIETLEEIKKHRPTPITIHNDTALLGEIAVKDKFGTVHLHFEFQTRLARKRMNDFINEAFAGKIRDNGYYVTITHY